MDIGRAAPQAAHNLLAPLTGNKEGTSLKLFPSSVFLGCRYGSDGEKILNVRYGLLFSIINRNN